MEDEQQVSHTTEPSGEERLTFDQYVEQLPASKRSIHRWLRWLVVVALVLALGAFVYAIYASFNAKSLGEAHVVVSWLSFFLAGALGAILYGLHTVVVGATLPLPSEGSKYSYDTGRKAVREGWRILGIGAIVAILAIVGMVAAQAGVFGLDEWVIFIVSFWAIVGIAAGASAILRAIRRSK
jgi:hypothetical protein